MLASGMIAGGMNWKQALFTVFLGNVLVLIPMLLNAHAGAQYGIPFPVFARASFGVLGANVPAILRALVACGWFGIQTWIGGEAINAMIVALAPGWANFHFGPAVCFFFFWLLNVLVILRGIETIRFLQGISAPFLLLIGLALLLWARQKAGGFGPMLATPSKFQTFGEFFRFFIPSLTGVVGFWATVSLNIPDFTRYARSQRDQIVGQALGLPATMTFYSFIGIAVTSSTLIIFGEALWNPVAVLARLGNPWAVVLAMIALLMATLNVNVAANVVSPANDFSNLSPRRISFRTGGLITCAMGIVMQPWKLMADYGSYIFGWLVGYSGSHLRLLRRAQKIPDRRRSLPAEWPVRILTRLQLDRRRGSGRGSRSSFRRPSGSPAPRPLQLCVVRGFSCQLSHILHLDESRCGCRPAGGLRRISFHGFRHHH
jgi:NCS1 family nucleobase:cation symporter-1